MNEKARPEVRTGSPVTLMLALVTLLLIVCGAGVTIVAKWWTEQPTADSLHAAAMHYPEDIPKLMTMGHRVDALDKQGRTPLFLAAVFGKGKSVKPLLDAGADANLPGPDGRTPLIAATFPTKCGANESMIHELLEAGADPSITESTNEKYSPLHHAVWGNSLVVVEDLIAHGADLESRDSHNWTPLHLATQFESTSVDIVRALVDAGADLEARGHDGNTPLHYAVSSHAHDKIEHLLKAGASRTAANEYGMLPIDQHQGDERSKSLFEEIPAPE
ncbi:MAG: ankyrin repeat domain-containing protein [Planctomycetaceae bacterium]|nr:ankyrin repeat domain-containing protein [Planctomycetaceae bacterium]